MGMWGFGVFGVWFLALRAETKLLGFGLRVLVLCWVNGMGALLFCLAGLMRFPDDSWTGNLLGWISPLNMGNKTILFLWLMYASNNFDYMFRCSLQDGFCRFYFTFS